MEKGRKERDGKGWEILGEKDGGGYKRIEKDRIGKEKKGKGRKEKERIGTDRKG